MMSPSGSLLFLVSGLERGGAELRLLDFARYFPKDLAFHLCVTSGQKSLLPDFQKHTGNIVFIPVKRPYIEAGKVREVGRYVREHGIDVVNTFDLKGLMTAVLVKRFESGIAIVHHAVNILHNYRPHRKALLFFLLRSAGAVVCNSREAARIMGRYAGSEKVQTIHNGIDTSLFRKNGSGGGLRKRLGIARHEVVLGTVANFRPEKNYPFLLENFKALYRVRPHSRLLLVGGGPLLDAAKKLAKEHAIADRVIFAGSVEDVRTYLDAMDIFVLCSSKESLPNALIQAMSMELPVLSARVGGCPEVVDHLVNGMLFEPNNGREFRKMAARLMGDGGLAVTMGRQGRRKIERAFSLEAMIGNYANYFRQLVAPGQFATLRGGPGLPPAEASQAL